MSYKGTTTDLPHRYGSDVGLRAWHSLKYLKTHDTKGISKVKNLDHLTDEEKKSFMIRLASDDYIMSGINIPLSKHIDPDKEMRYFKELSTRLKKFKVMKLTLMKL